MRSPNGKAEHERAQRVLIGYLLAYPSMATDILERLPRNEACVFTIPALREVFEAICDLHERGAEIAPHVVREEFKRKGRGAEPLPSVFVQCSDAASDEYQTKSLGGSPLDYVSAVRGGYYLGVVQEKAERAASFSEFLKVAEEAIALDAGPGGSEFSMSPISPVLDEVIEVQEAINEGRREPGYSWGIPELDEILLLRAGKLYTVAAQRGYGKTKFLLSVLHHNLRRAKVPTPSLLFSMEMDRVEVGKMLLSRETEIDSSLIHTKRLPSDLFDAIRLSSKAMARVPLEIDCSPRLSVQQIASRIRHWKLKNKIPDGSGIVGVDFLQLMDLDRQRGQVSEATALKNTAYMLAETAKRHQVCIVVLAQLNKEGDGIRPTMRFIEGSNGPSQASQAVLLLDVPRLRGEKNTQSKDGWDEFGIIVGKNRDGESLKTVHALADLSIGKFASKEIARVLPFRSS
jgi:replicative DNA helicase